MSSFRQRHLPWKIRLVVLALLLSANASSQSVQYKPVPREVVEARLQKYAGSNAQREATLKQLFVDAGCDGQQLTEQSVKGSKLPNVICKLPGSTDKTIIVGAHFDHVREGDGVVDNWSGASLLPSLYEAVKSASRTHTFIFIGFTDEEQGEVGSRFYAQHMSKDEVASTDVMVNMDTLGLAPTEVWTSHADKRLNGALFDVADQLMLPVSAVNVDNIGSSDSEQFAERKIPRITVHSLTQEAWNERILHSTKDRMSAIRIDDYYNTYALLSGYLAFLDQLQPEPNTK